MDESLPVRITLEEYPVGGIAPVAYQVILEPGIGQFREFEPRRVHAIVVLFPAHSQPRQPWQRCATDAVMATYILATVFRRGLR